MTIPTRPLEVQIDPETWTLGDARLFGGKLPDENDPQAQMRTIARFAEFLKAHTTWTEAEIDGIGFNEITTVFEELRQRLGEAAVPLANAPRSKNGHGRKRTRTRAGAIISPTPNSSTVTPTK